MFGLFKKIVDINNTISAPVDGIFVKMEDVPDPVFAQKMMGDGFAVKPSQTTVYSPVCGKVTSIFPTKHAIGIESDSGRELIVHMGVDTVSLSGKPFKIYVNKGDTVTQASKLAKVDLGMLAVEGREDVIIVAFPGASAEELKLGSFTSVTAGMAVGQL
ncbi:PTS glucose transporter subunit IIA [Streptococcus sp. ZJ93]|uniref:PTS sugar transporter subunit IIA n=1 Tax=Streptococcus handemini TaxID=3161188 RepID=UPI0032EDD3F0